MAKSIQKYLTLITAVIETFCVAGIIGGWNALDYVLTQQDYFSSGCNFSTTDKSTNSTASHDSSRKLCHSQEYNLELVFTISIVAAPIATLGAGVLLDRCGTSVLRNLADLIFVISCLAIAFSYPKISSILYPGVLLLGTSGMFIHLSELQTANFFPNFHAVGLNLINGAASASMVVLTIAKAAYENGISLMAIFLFLASFGVLILLRTYFLMPKGIIPYDVPDDFSYGAKENCDCSSPKCLELKNEANTEETHLLHTRNLNDLSELDRSDASNDNDDVNDDEPSLKDSTLTSLYILGSYSVIVQFFRATLFVEDLNAQLKFMLPQNPSLVSYDISLFG